jgi:hypothetical protein
VWLLRSSLPFGRDRFVGSARQRRSYLLHRWVNATLVTHTCAVGDYAGPHRFREGGVLID